MINNDPKQAHEYFDRKIKFSIGPMEVQHYKQQGEMINIIDVRSKDDFDQSHIPGAVNLPENEWPSLKGLAKDKPNIIYCYSIVCHLGAKASVFFASQGFSVIEMDGGWEYWQHYKLAEETGKSHAA